ncbi:inositol oxygenase 1-like isoform X2 [Prunus yedoensis var. nudiflora]|uniref:Inositol oxygenase n=1 Tax=Prunus yedoensis var. nudiflora TaxID=2094558 RepID=A0A314XMR7_PRUYE|nr:inositol oxygenase 1-like isoform X2 [Prunus yedoensis var. nudiflora]
MPSSSSPTIIAFRFSRMTILVEQPDIAVEVEEKKVSDQTGEENELVLDGGFVVPPTNAFGHTFRIMMLNSDRSDGVEEFYRINHINQSVDFVKRMREEYGKLNKVEMSIWECCELLNEVVDESDPDLDEPQIEHLLQTAEAIRKDYPNEGWLHLTALIHGSSSSLLLESFLNGLLWVTHALSGVPLMSQLFITSISRKILTTTILLITLSMVAKENKSTLPSAGLFIIRYHSFYALHRAGAYTHLMNAEDIENLKWLKIFNKYDLYSKSKVRIDVEKVKPYYLSLIEKYFPAKLRW